jgi:aryl-alcohol dehydrogenase-like predicted oxidoreductase
MRRGLLNLVQAAYEQGINFFDNADVYANGQAEVLMGKAIKDLPREALVISTKHSSPARRVRMGAGCLASTCLNRSMHLCAA